MPSASLSRQRRKVKRLKKRLETKLDKYGTVELMAFLAIREFFLKTHFYHPAEKRSNEPYMKYLFGLFLSNHNLDADRLSMDQVGEIEGLALEYFKNFDLLLVFSNTPNNQNCQINLSSQLQVLGAAVDPSAYQNQKVNYHSQVLSPLNHHFASKHGFTIEQAFNFSENITTNIRSKMEKEMNQYLSSNLEKTLVNLSHILIIDVDKYCAELNITDKDAFRNYLNTFSCTFGEQFNTFDDPTSENILSYKPFVKKNQNVFVIAQPLLISDTRLDFLLVHLLENEKQNKSAVWDEFNHLKSTYLENAVFKIFNKIFPNCVYKNIRYKFQGRDGESDLLVIYGNRVLIVESKSNNIPTYAMQLGNEELEKRLDDIVRKGYEQATKTKKYIQSNSQVTFWKDAKRKKPLVKTNSLKNNYKFYHIGVTLDDLGNLGTNPNNLEPLGYFTNNEYPWIVYLYDLDVIADMLPEPIYLVHYIEQRVNMHVLNRLESFSELDFLGFYLNNGRFSKSGTKTYADGSYIKQFDDYYIRSGKKPKLTMPKNFEKLLLDMQKNYKENFTDAACLLLDFSFEHKEIITNLMTKNNNKAAQTKKVAKFTILDDDASVGLSYMAYPASETLPQNLENETMPRGASYKITRFITIGKNMDEKEHQTAFFIYFIDGNAHRYVCC